MATSTEEKRILYEFINDKNNKNFILALLNDSLKDEVDDDVVKTVSGVIRDYSLYKFDGDELKKAPLVLAVVKKYVADYKPANFNDLEIAFPKELQGPYGVVQLDSKVKPKDKGKGGQKRFFVDAPITLKSGEIVLVCTQWRIDNIVKFIKTAEGYGYIIDNV